VGYADGHTRNPTYEEVCSGRAGHTEVELVVIDPKRISYDRLLKTFWESHNPALGMRQRNDVGTPIIPRSIASVTRCAKPPTTSSAAHQKALAAKGPGRITTEIAAAGAFYFAEDYHQRYLAKNRAGHCGLGGSGVAYPIGNGVRV
jgi:peptide-methionine (S)-S-oxide reductase